MSEPSPRDLVAELQACQEARERAEKALVAATETIKQLQAEIQSFAYAAGHDLREPLRAINAYSHLLQNTCKDDAQAAEFVRFIKDGVKAANHLIERLLTFSRAGSSAARSRIDLATVVQMALFSLSSPIELSQATVSVGDLPEATVNDSDLKVVFENLIENAIKYRGSDPPSVSVSADETDDGVLVTVADNGPGIEPRFHKDVFLPFKRLHGKEIPGAGLGLAIARKIITAHNGEIWVEPGPGRGAAFKFTLPY